MYENATTGLPPFFSKRGMTQPSFSATTTYPCYTTIISQNNYNYSIYKKFNLMHF